MSYNDPAVVDRGLLKREAGVLAVIDVQEKLLPHVHQGGRLLARLELLLTAANRLAVPVIVTEQYPKGLGGTVEAVRRHLDPYDPVVKMDFSCAPVPEFAKRLEGLGRTQLVVAGIEAHVCVAQSAIELAAGPRRVFVVADAVSSRRPQDAAVAVDRMRAAGVEVTTTEAVVFEWLRRAGTDEFRAIQAGIKALGE